MDQSSALSAPPDSTALQHDADLPTSPWPLFEQWWAQRVQVPAQEADAVVLATADGAGRPSARVVLLRQYDIDGLVFFTNYGSRKGLELAINPAAALLCYWDGLARQIRIEGQVERLAALVSDEYFDHRPRASQIGAWASAQSQPIADRTVLSRAVAAAEERFRDRPVPRPPHWGGLRLRPEVFEFWQGREARLHDRIRYERVETHWHRQRLSP